MVKIDSQQFLHTNPATTEKPKPTGHLGTKTVKTLNDFPSQVGKLRAQATEHLEATKIKTREGAYRQHSKLAQIIIKIINRVKAFFFKPLKKEFKEMLYELVYEEKIDSKTAYSLEVKLPNLSSGSWCSEFIGELEGQGVITDTQAETLRDKLSENTGDGIVETKKAVREVLERSFYQNNEEKQFIKKSGYTSPQELRDRLTIYRNLQGLSQQDTDVGKIAKKALINLENNRFKQLKYSLADLHQKLSEEAQGGGDKISAIFHAEMSQTIVAKETTNATIISQYSRYLHVQSFADSIDKQLHELCSSLEHALSEVDSHPKGDLDDNRQLLNQMRDQLKQLHDTYGTCLEYIRDVPEISSTGHAIRFGDYNQKFKTLQDLYDHAEAKILGSSSYDLSISEGDHFAKGQTTGWKLPRNSGSETLPSQYVPVVKSMHNLAGKIKEQKKVLKRLKHTIPLEAQETDKQILREKQKLKHMKSALKSMQVIDRQGLFKQTPQKEVGWRKKNVMVLTCSFGTGHKTATEALIKYFGRENTHASVADLSLDVMAPVDKLRTVGRVLHKDWNITTPFSYVLRHQLYALNNRFTDIRATVNKFLGLPHPGLAPENISTWNIKKKLLRERLLAERPEHILTSYHMDLHMVLEVAEELGIPVTHVPTDLDIKFRYLFKQQVADETEKYKHFRTLLPFDHDVVKVTAGIEKAKENILAKINDMPYSKNKQDAIKNISKWMTFTVTSKNTLLYNRLYDLKEAPEDKWRAEYNRAVEALKKRVGERVKDFIPEGKYAYGGFPIRPEFFSTLSEDEKREYKKQHGIDPDAKVVFVTGGGGGQEVPFPEILAKSAVETDSEGNPKKYHVIVIAGGNKAFGDNLKQRLSADEAHPHLLKGTNPHVKIEVATDPTIASPQKPYYVGAGEMSRLMDISDVAVIKPGGMTVAETLYKGLPVVVDHRQKELFDWEETNADVIIDSGRGHNYRKGQDFIPVLDETIQLRRETGEEAVFEKHDTGQVLWDTIMGQQAAAAPDPTIMQRHSFRHHYIPRTIGKVIVDPLSHL
ncbi:MAG: hypothetical protein ACQEP8_02980 [Chlamydiota bacterium]